MHARVCVCVCVCACVCTFIVVLVCHIHADGGGASLWLLSAFKLNALNLTGMCRCLNIYRDVPIGVETLKGHSTWNLGL